MMWLVVACVPTMPSVVMTFWRPYPSTSISLEPLGPRWSDLSLMLIMARCTVWIPCVGMWDGGERGDELMSVSEEGEREGGETDLDDDGG